MTLTEVENYEFWTDSSGNVWRRECYFTEPSVTFRRIWPNKCEASEQDTMGGAVGCLLLSDLKPLVTKEAAP